MSSHNYFSGVDLRFECHLCYASANKTDTELLKRFLIFLLNLYFGISTLVQLTPGAVVMPLVQLVLDFGLKHQNYLIPLG
jgi:hypothetical protein